MKILFVSHSYPPTLGGVEIQNFNLAKGLGQIAEVRVIANGKGKKHLPVFLPLTFFKILFLMPKYDACLMGNGVLAPLGAAARIFHPKKKFFCVIHGLDITFASKKGLLSRIYSAVNIPSLKFVDKLFMVGNATIEEAVKIGIERNHCIFIPNGIDAKKLRKPHDRTELSKLFGSDIQGKQVILRLARFVKHKGTSWFIENVMPKLPDSVVMIAAGHRVGKNTAGDKDNFSVCEDIIKEKHLENRVKLMPSLPQKDMETLLNTVDICVSPNIEVPGTMEGFGINVIEAGGCERVVIASDLEGLKDAIKDGKNGFLVEPENAEAWTEKINEILGKDDAFRKEFGKKAAAYVEENFNWEKISKRYLEEMTKMQ
ncbi:MAG: glycosyltransferase family 4 protein [Candidatus Moranbacteria bacterium]|nr:glycosyltransferase family 4 protein [Candidatus Moranbacteria bacterium]